MDTKTIEKFSIEAREQLLKDMEQQLYVYALDDAGRAEYTADADAIRGVVLSPTERAQRTELYRRIEREGTLPFITTMAYTWFNRFAAIRYMELAGHLPSHVRMLSASDGSFNPECLRVATTLDLPGLDQTEVAQLIQAGDDEALYRVILIAQCNELAAFLPSVFGTVTSDALTLPQNLLNKTEFNVLYRLVTDIPEDAWSDVEILGWMYQFYNSAVKAEFFKSKRKAGAADIAPATQLFTPDWIVRYMVDNSLGRLWMLNHPESTLRDYSRAKNPSDRLMEYYIEPDEEHKDFIRLTSPEDITFCDPACGSGHILVYAFKMLMAIYEECGYRVREVPELILTKNLTGFEIDQRAAQIAQLALAMCARKHDRRFFTRNITANICVLNNIDIDMDELSLTSPLRNKEQLLQDLAHLGEIGSLLQPTPEDIVALENDLAESNTGDLFSSNANEHVEQALAACRSLTRRFDIVVANPPYMGIRQINSWYADWLRAHYKHAKYDVYAAFISRMRSLAGTAGFLSFVSMHTWATDISAQKLRDIILRNDCLLSMVVMEAGVMPIAFQTSATTLQVRSRTNTADSCFVGVGRNDLLTNRSLSKEQFDHISKFHRNQSMFLAIPMEIIAYWVYPSMLPPLASNSVLSDLIRPRVGIQTGDTERFTRQWWEVSSESSNITEDYTPSFKTKWVKYRSGGDFRKWYGNESLLINWLHNGESIIEKASLDGRKVMNLPAEYRYRPMVCWSDYGMGAISFRYSANGFLFDVIEPAFVATSHDAESYLPLILAYGNSSVAYQYVRLLMPGRHKNVGKVAILPLLVPKNKQSIEEKTIDCVAISKADWDSQETSWEFKRHPLI